MKKIFFGRIILLFLFITLVFGIKSYATSSDFTYELDSNNYATITSYKGSNSNITIPSTIDGYEVKKISNHAFNESRTSTNGKVLANVTVSEGITTIGDFAFVGCTNLESIKLPETLTSLGDQTFIGCTKLKQINIPSQITQLGITGSMFQETGFTEFTIPENVKKVPSSTFRICQNLKKVIVHSDDVEYGSSAFEYCSADLVLYGNEGSTTQSYAEQNGLKFEVLSNENENENIPVTSITLNKTSLSLFVGDSETLIASILPDNATDKTVIWSSSNSNVVTVENGKVTAKSAGSATVSVSNEDGSQKASCNITVKNKDIVDEPTIIPITSITLNKTSLSLFVGDSETLIASILPDNATDKTVIWSSSNSNVVTVENGKVTAKSAGSATVSVSNEDGSQKASCNITVNTKATNSETPKDDTTINSNLPQAGSSYSILIVLFALFIVMFISYTGYKKLRKI